MVRCRSIAPRIELTFIVGAQRGIRLLVEVISRLCGVWKYQSILPSVITPVFEPRVVGFRPMRGICIVSAEF